jgi:hypothetical protein
LATNELKFNLAKSWGKKRGEKKVSVWNENTMEK